MPCKCGSVPNWDWRSSIGMPTREYRLYCHAMNSGWEPTIDKAIARWNDEVAEAKE